MRPLGHPIAGERVRKKMKSGERFYTSYRCTSYTKKKDHAHIRATEADLDGQKIAIVNKMRMEDGNVGD